MKPNVAAAGWRSLFWQGKAVIARLPFAFSFYKFITGRFGEGRIYTIRWGPMAGLRWRRHNRHPFWYHMGLYEPEVSRLLQAHLRPGDVFWDVGANAGYHTLLAARLVGARGHVVAVEPDPDTVAMLRAHLEFNSLTHSTVLPAAVAEKTGTVTFLQASNPLQSALSEVARGGTPVAVESTTLDDMARCHPWPDVIKIDVEGAEGLVLQGGQQLLADERRPRLLLSTHGDAIAETCRRFLQERGYHLEVPTGFEQMIVAMPRLVAVAPH